MNSTVSMVLRYLLGAFILFFGLNKFFGFMPFPEMGGDADELMRIWNESGFMKIVGAIETLSGLALLLNKYVPLALTFIVAVLFNAVLFHVMHHMESIPGAIFGIILAFVLVYANKDRFKELFTA